MHATAVSAGNADAGIRENVATAGNTGARVESGSSGFPAVSGSAMVIDRAAESAELAMAAGTEGAGEC